MSITKTIRNAASALLLAGAMCNVFADDKPKEPENKVFFGMTAEKRKLDGIVDYRNNNGAQVTLEDISYPWDSTTDSFGFGVRTPKLGDKVRLNLEGELTDDYQLTGFGEYFPTGNVTLRLGGFQTKDGVSGPFVGGKYQDNKFTVDADVWHDGSVNAHGFVAYIIGDKLYVSAGGDSNTETINTILGYLNQGQPGGYARMTFDLDDNVQKGKVVLARKFNYNKGNLDFRNHVDSNTEMRGTGNVGTLDSWAPSDAFASEDFTLSVKWLNNEDKTDVKGMVYFRPTADMYVGAGVADSYDKNTGEHSPLVGLEVYTIIPGTPFYVDGSVDIDPNTGEISPSVYLGGTIKW